jgi:glycerol uptake facilitator-like aquaporin
MVAEAIGDAFLMMSILAPAIFVDRLTPGNGSLALLAVGLAVLAVLYVIITALGPVSGAHFNPLVTLASLLRGEMSVAEAAGYLTAQVGGAIFGVMVTHWMFELPALALSETSRTGAGQWLGEVVATFGLFVTIEGCRRAKVQQGGWPVALYVYGAVWFTSSTCFANPAVTLARALTDTPTGILPADAPMFVLSEAVGAGLALLVFGWMFRGQEEGR